MSINLYIQIRLGEEGFGSSNCQNSVSDRCTGLEVKTENTCTDCFSSRVFETLMVAPAFQSTFISNI